VILVNDLTFLPLALIHDRLLTQYRKFDFPPSVSILIPAYNEEKDIESLLRTLFEQTYKNMEIVVINDGSTDNTRSILEPYANQGKIRLLNLGPPNLGKYAALNAGIKIAKGEIIVVVDADGLLERDAVANMLVPFADPNVMSVSGNIRVANPVNILTRCQALEYVRDINIPRRAFDLLNIALVVPGPLGAFRRSVAMYVGEYDPDTVTEDFDITVKVQKARDGRQVASRNVTNAVAYTEAPERLSDLIRQRRRWYGGMAQTYWKHRRYRMWRGSGVYSRVGVPYLFYSLFIIPVLELIMFGVTLIGLVVDPIGIIIAYVIFTVMETMTSILGVMLDHADWRLVLLSPLYVIGYRQLLDFIRVYSYIEASRGRLGWERAQRFGDTSIKARSVLDARAER
jgi:cellulose synthase/poly-beta-1,6-N-acetylglucosamine synthase-like glycosyltransferase